jgi:hypothetical protein
MLPVLAGRLVSLLQFPACAIQLFYDDFLVRQNSLVFSGEYIVGKFVECVVRLSGSLLGAQKQAKWRLKCWTLVSTSLPADDEDQVVLDFYQNSAQFLH